MSKGCAYFFLSLVFTSYACDDLFKKDKDNSPTKLQNVKMAVLGDSVAVGLFADMTMGEPLTEDMLLDKVGVILFGDSEEASTKVQALANLDIDYKAKHENAYSYGVKQGCFSHACRLELEKEKVSNQAVSGAQVVRSDPKDTRLTLQQQYDKLAKDVDEIKTVEYYVINIGGNDFCADSFDKDNYIAGLKKVVDKIYAANKEAKVLLVPLPNIVHLFQTVAPSDTNTIELSDQQREKKKNKKKKKPKQHVKCKHIRDGHIAELFAEEGAEDANTNYYDNNAAFCPRLAVAANKEVDWDAMATELTAVNEAIIDLEDMYTNRKFKVAAGVKDLDFKQEHLSVDCFHPNKKGLKMLGDETYKYYQQL